MEEQTESHVASDSGLESEVEVFDWKLYGSLVRRVRMNLGYKKAEDFAASIWRRTRVKISRDTLYKIEQGRQVPDAAQFMAINLALSGTKFYPWITDLCTSPEWRGIEEASGDGTKEVESVVLDLPPLWKGDNLLKAKRDSPEFDMLIDVCDYGEGDMVPIVREYRWLFPDGPEPFERS